MRSETQPNRAVKCTCVIKVGVALCTADTICSAHMTIQLMASGHIYSVLEPEAKRQLLQKLCRLLHKQPTTVAADPLCHLKR